MTESERILSQLRDIHEPLPPEGLAASVWLISAAVLLLLAGVIYFVLRQALRKRVKPLSSVAHHCTLAKNEPSDAARLRLARLLRQHVLREPNTALLHSSGEPWLKHLDNTFNTTWFTQGNGRQFGDDLYAINNTTISEADCQQVQKFLDGLNIPESASVE